MRCRIEELSPVLEEMELSWEVVLWGAQELWNVATHGVVVPLGTREHCLFSGQHLVGVAKISGAFWLPLS